VKVEQRVTGYLPIIPWAGVRRVTPSNQQRQSDRYNDFHGNQYSRAPRVLQNCDAHVTRLCL